MATQSAASTNEPGKGPSGAPSATVKWSLLGDCSHSSAIAVGSRCRLAFHKDGLQAFGGYIEGFLPATFAVEAVASDDKILAFLSLSDTPSTLKATKDGAFELRRGQAMVKFTAGSESAMPNIPEPPADSVLLEIPPGLILDAMMDCVPKTGWGAMNTEMLGAVIDPDSVIATDNTSLAWATVEPVVERAKRIILPRPFCMALTRWIKALGDKVEVTYTSNAVYAVWETGEVLMGALPVEGEGVGMDFSGLQQECVDSVYAPLPDGFSDLLAEAAIFSDDIIFESANKQIKLSTPGPISWHRTVAWSGKDTKKAHVLPLKRLTTALEYCNSLSVSTNDRMFLLANSDTGLYVVISTK